MLKKLFERIYPYIDIRMQSRLFCDLGVPLPNDLNTKRKDIYMEWISVKDRLPEQEALYLVYDSSNKEWGLSYFIVNGSYRYFDIWESLDITHWMPLPSPPNQ